MSTINLPAYPVEVTAGGVSRNVNLADFPAVTVEAIVTYGMRRWFQDYVNSSVNSTIKAAEKSAADNGETFDPVAFKATIDVESIMADRIAMAMSGDFKAHGAGVTFTEEQHVTYDIVTTLRAKLPAIAAAWKASKGASTADRKTAVLAAFDSLPDGIRAKLAKPIAAEIKRRAGLAALDLGDDDPAA